MLDDPRFTLERIEQLAVLGERIHAGTPTALAGANRRRATDLERRVGVELFTPPGFAPALTPAGEAAVAWASGVLSGASALGAELSELFAGQRGRIDLVASLTIACYVLPSILATFHRRYPSIELRVQVTDADRALDLVAAGSQDLAIVSIQPHVVPQPLVAEPIGVQDVIFVAAGNLDAPPAVVTAAELEQLTFVDASHGVDRRARELRAAGVTQRNIRARLGHPEAVKDAVRAGLGVAMLPRATVQADLDTGALREFRLEGAQFGVPTCFVRRADAQSLDPVHERLLRHITGRPLAPWSEGPRVGLRLAPGISLYKLQVLATVVELASVSRAAERLMLTQPVVSVHIRSLERALGCVLFERIGGHQTLTQYGEAVYRWALQTLRSTRALQRRVATLSAASPGPLVVAASMTVGSDRLSRVMSAFMDAHPEIAFREELGDAGWIIDATEAGTIDFGLLMGDVPIDPQRLRSDTVGHERVMLVGAPGTFDAPVGLSDLAGFSFVTGRAGDLVDEFVDQALGLRRPISVDVGHPEAIKQLLREGSQVAFLPISVVASDVVRGHLDATSVDGLDLAVTVKVVYPADRVLEAVEREFIDRLREDFRRDSPAPTHARDAPPAT